MVRRRGAGIVTPDSGEGIHGGYTPSVDMLTTVHPLYRKYSAMWEKTIDLAEGENLAKYIDRHSRESEESHQQRQRRTPYRNFVDPILGLVCAYLFSKPITRTPGEAHPAHGGTPPFSGARVISIEDARRRQMPVMGPDLGESWKLFLYDVDRQGNSIDRFMRRVTYWAQALGMAHILVDLPRVERAPRSLAEQRSLGLMPYFSLYLPTDLVNWEIDHENRFTWVRYREPITDDVGPFQERRSEKDRLRALDLTIPAGSIFDAIGGRTIRRPARALYRTFTRTEWWLHEVDGSRVTERGYGVHGLGLVPNVTLFNRQRARFPVIGRSEVHDIIGINQAILNIDSLITESTYQQVLNILVMRRQQNQQKEIIVGPENVLTYTGDQPPFFITPSTAPLQFMESRVQGLVQEIYRLAKFTGGSAMQVRAVPSGVAATVEFNETDRALAEKAEEIQNAEWLMHDVWCRYFGRTFDGTIDYPDSFQVQPFLEELNQITQAKNAVRSDRFIRELEKRVAARMLPNVPQETLDAIEAEIDIIPPSISSFSGPVWYDPLTQEIKQPTDQAAGPIGVLGRLSAQMQGRGGEPDDAEDEEGDGGQLDELRAEPPGRRVRARAKRAKPAMAHEPEEGAEE